MPGTSAFEFRIHQIGLRNTWNGFATSPFPNSFNSNVWQQISIAPLLHPTIRLMSDRQLDTKLRQPRPEDQSVPAVRFRNSHDLGSDSFASTQGNAALRHGNTNPRRAYNRRSDVELTAEATRWLRPTTGPRSIARIGATVGDRLQLLPLPYCLQITILAKDPPPPHGDHIKPAGRSGNMIATIGDPLYPGANDRALRAPCPGHDETVGCPHRRQHRQRPGTGWGRCQKVRGAARTGASGPPTPTSTGVFVVEVTLCRPHPRWATASERNRG